MTKEEWEEDEGVGWFGICVYFVGFIISIMILSSPYIIWKSEDKILTTFIYTLTFIIPLNAFFCFWFSHNFGGLKTKFAKFKRFCKITFTILIPIIGTGLIMRKCWQCRET